VGSRFTSKAEDDIDDIRKYNSQPTEGQKSNEQDEDLAWLEAIASSGETEVECVVALLSEAQRGGETDLDVWCLLVGGHIHVHFLSYEADFSPVLSECYPFVITMA
jgi:hypothetical protein